jgi:hypothetical protein
MEEIEWLVVISKGRSWGSVKVYRAVVECDKEDIMHKASNSALAITQRARSEPSSAAAQVSATRQANW